MFSATKEEGRYETQVATKAIIRRRVPVFDAVLSTTIRYDDVSRTLVGAFTPDPRFDSLLAFGFRYSGRMHGSSFWLRRVTDRIGIEDPTVVHGTIESAPTGAEITLRASNPLRQLLRNAILTSLTGMVALIIDAGTSTIYVGAMFVLLVAGVTVGWYLLTPWLYGLQAMRDLASVIDRTNTIL